MKMGFRITGLVILTAFVISTPVFAAPDLVISRINYSPGQPKQNQAVTFWVFVKNNGNTAAGESKLQFIVGGSTSGEMVNVPALPPGKEWRYTSIKRLARKGQYIIRAVADAGKTITESHEKNNQRRVVVNVKKGPAPDLVISVMRSSPRNLYEDEVFTYHVIVKNRGTFRAKKSRLRVNLGGNSQGTYADVPVLSPGQSWRFSKKYTFNTPGNYMATAIADVTGSVVESHEDNNKKQVKFTINKGPRPDASTRIPNLGIMGGGRIGGKTWQQLTTAEITLSDNDVYKMDYGKVQIHLVYKYRNYNDVAVNKAFKNRVYYNNQLVDEQTISSLGRLATGERTVVFEVPDPGYNERATLKIEIDADKQVQDSNPNNNEGVYTLKFVGL